MAEPWPAPAGTVLYEEGRRLFKEKQLPAAMTQLQKCIKHEPKNYECHKLLGMVYAKLDKSAQGAKEYQEFLRLAPPDHPAIPQVKAILDQFVKHR